MLKQALAGYEKALEIFTMQRTPTSDILGDLPGLLQKLQGALTLTDDQTKQLEEGVNVASALGNDLTRAPPDSCRLPS